jgi:hypothetical protein
MFFSKRLMVFSLLAGTTVLAIPRLSLAQESTRNGALLGGATGAVIGGIIGNNKNDQTAEGALIGGAVGAVAGGWIGHQRDRVAAEQRRQAYASRYSHPHQTYSHPVYSAQGTYYPQRNPYSANSNHQHRYAGPGQPTIVYSAPVVTRQGVYRSPSRPTSMPVRQPVTMSDVIHMTRSGVSDQVIVSRIQANGMAQSPSVDDVIALSQEGVSDYVIASMQGENASAMIIEPASEVEYRTSGNQGAVQLMPVPPIKNPRPSQRRGF